jgi:hypothetical protein
MMTIKSTSSVKVKKAPSHQQMGFHCLPQHQVMPWLERWSSQTPT